MNTKCKACGETILVQIYKGEDWCSENCKKILEDFRCFYRPLWTDEVGEIDVCVRHGHNSKHDTDDPRRPCLAVDPYEEVS